MFVKNAPGGRLLFVVGSGRLDPASIKRVYDLLPFLQRLGYKTDVVSYRWEWLWHMRGRAAQNEAVPRGLLRTLNAARLTSVLIRRRERRVKQRLERLASRADVVIVLQTFLDESWRDALRRSARPLVYEFDDAVWLNDENGFAEMMSLAHTVVAGNGFLATHARHLHTRVCTIPTGVRLDRYEAAPERHEKDGNEFVIGWLGSPSTVRYLEQMVEPLAELGAQMSVAFEIVGSGSSSLPAFRNVEVHSRPRIPYDPVRFAPGFDVGVMPLEDTPWERGKCGAKLLEYMAAALPAVCSRVGENRRIVENGVSGFLVHGRDEWVSALSKLARDPDLRRRVGLAARERVRAAYCSQTVALLWDECLATVYRLQGSRC
ncbi:MAG: glycosyltransferase family 4 protein [Acidobacteriota bacterium]